MNLELGDENSWVEYVSKYWHSACNGGEGGGVMVRAPDAAMIPTAPHPQTPSGFITPNKGTVRRTLILIWTSNFQQRF